MPRPCRTSDRGTVTLELALLFPVLLATILFGLWTTGVVIANVRCLDAARDVARALARGESVDTAEAIGRRAAPPGAAVQITQTPQEIEVLVTTDGVLAWPLVDRLPTIAVRARAVLQPEPSPR